MYLEEIYLENTGPISKCHVKPSFDNNENPLPIVIVGPNGSGKSVFLSYIVDALMEFAKEAFRDIVSLDSSGQKPYFRIIRPAAIKSGEPFSLSLLHFKANNDSLYYCEKAGVLDPETYSPSVKSVFMPLWNWSTEGNYKRVLTGKEDDLMNDWLAGEIDVDISPVGEIIKTEMRNGAYAFFPASRHEDPVWLNPRSLEVNMGVPVNPRFSTELDKPLRVETCAERNIGWILDVLFDAAVDFDIIQRLQRGSDDSLFLSEEVKRKWNGWAALQVSRENIEYILRKVVQDERAKLEPRLRNNPEHRLVIQLADGQRIPNLQSLSEGQSQLFHLFTTIIRYGERDNLVMSVRLADITGIVVIDEIASHLHPTLQHDVLPQLIKMFPKVQFIVSSHSPLFLLGMEKEFGPDGLDILELPDGDRITSERFSEFGKAFEYYQNTERFESEIKQLIAKITKPVVMTEGKLDVRYIRAALEMLGEEELLNSLEIRPIGKMGKKGDEDGGKDGLNRVLNFHKKDSSLINQPMLLLYDWDSGKPDEQIEKLWVRSIPKNPDDDKEGIENLLPTDLFEDRFYDNKIKKGIHGRNKVDPKFKKVEFCQWICEERKDPADFEEFKKVVEILKQFKNTYQPPSGQQPASE